MAANSCTYNIKGELRNHSTTLLLYLLDKCLKHNFCRRCIVGSIVGAANNAGSVKRKTYGSVLMGKMLLYQKLSVECVNTYGGLGKRAMYAQQTFACDNGERVVGIGIVYSVGAATAISFHINLPVLLRCDRGFACQCGFVLLCTVV